jgi:hypothetical protein
VGENELILILPLQREGLVGNGNFAFYNLTEGINKKFYNDKKSLPYQGRDFPEGMPLARESSINAKLL